MDPARLGVIGGGVMARAIIEGVGAALPDGRPAAWIVAEPDADRRSLLAALPGVIATVPTAAQLLPHLGDAAQLLLAVKPQALTEVEEITGRWSFDGVAISILAGAGSERVRAALGGRARVIRVMPNTPASIGRGMSAVAIGSGAEPGDDATAVAIFRAVGEVVRLDEALIDAFTGVAGSGPAYLFLLAEAMATGATNVGLPAPETPRIVAQTLLGAAELLAREAASGGLDASALRAAVTSRGGTTAAALDVLGDAGVVSAVVRAIEAARDRGRELGG